MTFFTDAPLILPTEHKNNTLDNIETNIIKFDLIKNNLQLDATSNTLTNITNNIYLKL